MTKREELYCLLKIYKEGKYNISDFCDELTRILYYENNGISELSNYERENFEVLANVAQRYSPYEEDRNMSKWYCDDNEVKDAIEVAFSKLNYMADDNNKSNSIRPKKTFENIY